LLSRRGIEVATGVCRAEAESLIAPFAKWIATGLPFVTLKLAVTLDGRIADAQGRSKWITGPEARRRVQALRRRADAVLVGRATVEADNPSLLCRARRTQRLLRFVVDSEGRLPTQARVLSDAEAARTVVATTGACSAARQRRIEHAGARVMRVRSKAGRVSMRSLMRRMGSDGLLHVLCEGGAQVAEALTREGLVDDFVFFVAPNVLGGAAVSAVGGAGWSLGREPGLRFTACERVGDDIMLKAVYSAERKRRGGAACSQD
jgi:diaminohydroxyphosphoribosylaminopyrimidine deaminase/5-amino-6-(5-phosphoribosylamino)uracil reductase